MLTELRIENLLLIDKAELRFGPGLNVITGETGAGKTVLAQSLSLILGEKPRHGIIRPGAEEAWVEACFDLPGDDAVLSEQVVSILERIPAGSEEVTLSRRVSATGRTSAYIGGRGAPAADLDALGRALLAFHGQHSSKSLTSKSEQLQILDSAGGSEVAARLTEYRAAHSEVRRIEGLLDEHRRKTSDGGRQLDLLKFEQGEIEDLDPDADEHAELVDERSKLRNLDSIRESVSGSLAILEGGELGDQGAVTASMRAAGELSARAGNDSELDQLARRIESASIELQDASADLRAYASGLEDDPERSELVESRLSEYDRLQRKHQVDASGLAELNEQMASTIKDLEAGSLAEDELISELESKAAERELAATKLTEARIRIADDLGQAVTGELAELAMQGAMFEVRVAHRDDWTDQGRDQVQFMLATSSGISAGPVADTASGGELSRVMLALIQASGGLEGKVSVFDEIDAGLGGTTARRVGAALKSIANREQVITITHLPQVASLAAHHFKVERVAGADPAVATVERLDRDAVVDEVTRMLGAEEGDSAAAEHARELVESGSGG